MDSNQNTTPNQIPPVAPLSSFGPANTPAPNPSMNPAAQAAPNFGPAPQQATAPTSPSATQPGEPLIDPTKLSQIFASPDASATTPSSPATSTAPAFDTIGSTDFSFNPSSPLTQPEPAKQPDPVAQELEMPLKAAAPVPGSLGSAISMPAANQSQPQSTSFSDPSVDPTVAPTTPIGSSKKSFLGGKMDKKTLTTLCAVAGLVVVALAVVLILMLTNTI